MAKTTEQANKRAFLPAAYQSFLNADVDSIKAEGAQVDNLVKMVLANLETLDSEVIKLYLEKFESAAKAAGKPDASIKVFKSRRKRVLEFAIGALKGQKADPEKWSDRSANAKQLALLAQQSGSLALLYKEIGETLKAEGDDKPEESDAAKVKKAFDKFLAAGHTVAELQKILTAYKADLQQPTEKAA